MDFVTTTSQLAKYTTKELSKATWPDFVKLFSQKSGWNHCWCVHFHRPRGLPRDKWLPTREERGVRNRREQKALVDKGRSHGILVYSEGQPVGWCQYGQQEELTRIDNGANYRGLAPENQKARLWRITCFVVDRKYRRRGVAGAALQAALASIKKQGGGLVEGFPVSNWEGGSFGNMSTHGTVSMFAKQGFKKVAAYGNTNVLMRKRV
jgi:ribosomal protein S18 acetylase RimI-like enzyme